MKTLIDYKKVIRDTVKEINEKDSNHDWKLVGVTESRASIKWSYLNGEKNNCFFLSLSYHDTEFEDYFLTCRTPNDNLIEGHFVCENPEHSWDESFEGGIKRAIYEILEFANNVY